MNSNYSRYGQRRSGGQHGDVFTSPETVSYMLDIVGYSSDKDLRSTSILEPACGEGEFVVEIVKRLLTSSKKYGFDLVDAFSRNVFAYDIDDAKVTSCRYRVAQLYPSLPLESNIRQSDFLSADIGSFDMVVGNPPYVRYEQIPSELIQSYKRQFHTFHYRSDLYILFFEKSLKHLKPQGHHCFICSNRWLKNEYGKKLRGWIARSFKLESIISLEKASDVFQEDVLAYPAITLITNALPDSSFTFSELTSITESGGANERSLPVPVSSDWSTVFNHIQGSDTLSTIEDMGFSIGVGAATGADSIFIADDLPRKVEKELLLPSINAKDLANNHLQWSGRYLLNPYKPNGSLIDLDDYPLAAKYLSAHRETLAQRHIAKKYPGKWYKTIDRIIPALKSSPKILLPDISGNQYIFVDNGAYYPQHNLYYITGGSLRQLQLLSAMLMTDYVKNQLLNITNCMHGGYPRWQGQYLRKLLMPNINDIESNLADALLDAYQRFDLPALNATMGKILAQSRNNNSKSSCTHQLSFDFAI